MGDAQVCASRNPVLVVYDNKSTMIGAWQTYEKGAVQWVAAEVAKFIEMIGYGQIRTTLKSDGEPAITALKKLIAAQRDAPTTLIQTPARESKCNGSMEVRVKAWQSQFRTMMIDLRKCIGRRVPLLGNVTSWLVLWAATVLNKYKLDKAGRTPYQRVTGVRKKRPIAKFGEKIMYMPNGKEDPGLKAEGNMFEGVFLGLRNHGIEALVAVEGGVIAARTIRRKSEDDGWCARSVTSVCISVGTNLNDGEEPSGAPVQSDGPAVYPPRTGMPSADDNGEQSKQSISVEPETTAQRTANEEESSRPHPVRVHADEDDRVMFEEPDPVEPEVDNDEMEFNPDSPQYAPASPASTQKMDEEVGDEDMDTPPRASRRRLRPHRDPNNMESPESERSRAPKAARVEGSDDELLNALGKLKQIKSEIDQERHKIDQRMLMLVMKGVDISEIYSPPGLLQWQREWDSSQDLRWT